jgi:hypothetical protein
MGPWLAFLLAVCASQNQEPPAPKQEPESKPVAYSPENPRPVLHIGATGRGLFPVSSMARDINAVPNGSPFPTGDLLAAFDWSDFFKVGVGGSLEFDVLWERSRAEGAPPVEDEWVMGAYATIGFDVFQGSKASDPRGSSLDPENLEVFSFLLGPKLVRHFGDGFFIDGRLGMGVVHYASVDADMHLVPFGPGSPQDFRGEFLRATATFGMELGFRGGLRSGSTSFVLGAGVRILAAPDRGNNAEISASTLVALGIDLGVELGF